MTRFLVIASLMILELAGGIAGILGVLSDYHYRPIDEGGAAACVAIVGAILVTWLLTIAFFLRRSSADKAGRLLDQARAEAARIINDASEKAMAMCSLDSGKCTKCGNPRTGKFCPRCGAAQNA